MIDDIRNLVGDVASRGTKDATIELTNQLASLFAKQLEDAKLDNEALQALNVTLQQKNLVLENEISALRETARKAEPSANGLDDDCISILNVFDEKGEAFAIDISHSAGMKLSDVKYCIGELLNRKFVRYSRAITDSRGSGYNITHEGRSFLRAQ